MFRPTWVEIDLASLRHNIQMIQSRLKPGTLLMAVVKADAYGHGLPIIARHALEHGASMLCVAIPEEGMQLRENGVTAPILVLGGVTEDGMEASVRYDLIQTVYDVQTIRTASDIAAKLGKKAYLDLKIDTGMNRIGVKDEQSVRALIGCALACPHVRVHGAFTHFAVADEDRAFTALQHEKFLHLTAAVRQAFPQAILHCSNSAAIFLHSRTHMDAVRAGIVLYGSAPTPTEPTGLHPVMSWKTKILHVKRIMKGETVSYGREFAAEEEVTVATLPVGYGDGYKRIIGGRGHVLVGGRKAPVIGRVCMDQIMVDISGTGAKTGDEAVLLGKQGKEVIRPWDMALWADTIPYEITLSVSPRVPRIVIDTGCAYDKG